MAEVTYKYGIDVITVEMFGFSGDVRKAMKEDGTEYWSVSFPSHVVALNQKMLREYIMFLELVEFYVQELNS